MNEHTFFEWKRSERLTAVLALAFCLLGLWLSSTAGAISVSVDESSLSVPNHPAGYSLYRS